MAEHIIIPDDCEVITKGHTAKIYLVSDDIIIKVNRLLPLDRFRREFRIQNDVYRAGYPVAKPYSSIVNEQHDSSYEEYGISMERIYGRDLEDIKENTEDLMNEAEDIVKNINEKLGIGIRLYYGLHPRNVMFDEKNNRVVLVDFGHWNYLSVIQKKRELDILVGIN